MHRFGGLAGAAALLVAGAAFGDETRDVGGHVVRLAEDGLGGASLSVDGTVLHEDGVIYLDAEPYLMGGVTLVTGVAGAGGNACNAAPFVLALAEGVAPVFHGPVKSCAYLPIVDVQSEAIIFASEPLPSEPGEVWVWSLTTGFTEAQPKPFAPTEGTGWEALEDLADSHPAEALALKPVFDQLQAGLGAQYDSFAERISGLGAGNLAAEGYLGSACIKLTCEADWAILYLHRESERAFAIWHVSGEIENRIFPQDTTVWPPEAMFLLRESAGP